MDTGGNHEVDCPNHVMIETLTMSKQAYKQLTGYMDYKGEIIISERELAEMGMDEYSQMLKKEDEA